MTQPALTKYDHKAIRILKIINPTIIDYLVGGICFGIITNILFEPDFDLFDPESNLGYVFSFISFLFSSFLLVVLSKWKKIFIIDRRGTDNDQEAYKTKYYKNKALYIILIFIFSILITGSGIVFLVCGKNEVETKNIEEKKIKLESLDSLFIIHSSVHKFEDLHQRLDSINSYFAKTASCDSVLIYLQKLQIKK